MFQQLELTDSEKCLVNFTKQGTMRNGQLYQREIWEPVIYAKDGSLLPTPTARDHKDCGPNFNFKKAADKSRLAGTVNVLSSAQPGAAMYLNPCFLEEMMGYPIAWTELKPSVTQ